MARIPWRTVFLASLFATAIHAEVGDRTPEELRELSSSVIVGTVQRVYVSVELKDGFEYTHCVAEIALQSVEAGPEFGPVAYARYWSRRWVGEGPAPASGYGHRGSPTTGQTVRVFLSRSLDGGLDVVYPNGFQVVAGD